MDQRIGDLRERLHKKRAEVQNAPLYPQLFYPWIFTKQIDLSMTSLLVTVEFITFFFFLPPPSWAAWTVEYRPPLRIPPKLAVEFLAEWRPSAPTSRFLLRGNKRRGTLFLRTPHPNPPPWTMFVLPQVGRIKPMFSFMVNLWALTFLLLFFSCLFFPVFCWSCCL